MSRFTGAPKTTIEVSDQSLLKSSNSVGAVCLAIPTARGIKNKPVLVTSSAQFKREFGGILSDDNGVIIAMRLLDAGIALYISPLAHYSDHTDLGTISGTKSTGTINNGGVAETRADAPAEVTAVGDDDDTVSITVNNGSETVNLGTYTKTAAQSTATQVAQAIVDMINAGTGTHGYSATKNATGNFDVVAPVGTGAGANNYTLNVSVIGNIVVTGDSGSFADGVTATLKAVALRGKDVGPGYNGTVTITASTNNKTGFVDIEISLPDSDRTTKLSGVKANPTTAELANINKQLRHVDITSITNEIPTGSITLAGGSQDVSEIVVADYTGNQANKTGWWSFQDVDLAYRILQINPDADIDVSLATFCEASLSGGNPKVFHTTHPESSDKGDIIDYRKGTGAYDHTPINSYLGRLVAGYTEIPHPEQSGVFLNIPSVVDVLPLQLKKDAEFGPWYSAAGRQRGVITSAWNRMLFNFGAAENDADYSAIYNEGVNAVVVQNGELMYAGNRSLYNDLQSLLSRENVADLVVYLIRTLNPKIKKFQFDPNDPLSWKSIYREVLPIIQDLAQRRAIRPIQDQDWFWQGDQEVDDYRNVQFNTVEDIEAGIYRARFIFIPISAMEYVGIDLTLTSTGRLSFIINEDINV